MTYDNFVQLAIPYFDGYYDHWSMLMENFLRSKECWHVVSIGIKEPVAGVMWIHGEKMIDIMIIENILRSITPKLNNVVCLIEESKDLNELSIDELQGTFLVHENFFVLADNNTSISNRSVDQGRGSGSGKGGRGNRDEGRQYHNYKNDNDPSIFQGKGKGRDQGFDKFKVECYRCHKLGCY
ncbi:hypothetical protein AAG906_037516 [Vitis piasezkii]